jgi:hypothetical protein
MMRWLLTSLTGIAVAASITTSGIAQTPPAKDAPVAGAPPPAKTVPATKEVPKYAQPKMTPSPEVAARKAAPRKTALARANRRHLARSQHRRRGARGPRHERWQYVWVYRAHEPHGERHYHYIRRNFGGYFAPGCSWR